MFCQFIEIVHFFWVILGSWSVGQPTSILMCPSLIQLSCSSLTSHHYLLLDKCLSFFFPELSVGGRHYLVACMRFNIIGSSCGWPDSASNWVSWSPLYVNITIQSAICSFVPRNPLNHIYDFCLCSYSGVGFFLLANLISINMCIIS